MASGPSKRPKPSAATLRRLLYVGDSSMTSLLTLMKVLREEGPDVLEARRWRLRQARDDMFNELMLSWDIPLSSGDGTFTWQLVDPLLLLSRAVREQPNFRRLFSAAARRSPPSRAHPWRLAIGFDAFVPGLPSTVCISCLFHVTVKEAVEWT